MLKHSSFFFGTCFPARETGAEKLDALKCKFWKGKSLGIKFFLFPRPKIF